MLNFLIEVINSKSKSFASFGLAFLAGVFLASIFDFKVDFFYLYSVILVLFVLLICFWQKKSVRFVVLSFCLIIFGIGRYSFFYDLPENHISTYNGKNIEFEAVVVQEPDVRIDATRYIVEAKKVLPDKEINGRVYVKLNRYPDFRYGDVLRVSCSINEPEEFEDFRFDKYLALKKTFSFCVLVQAEKIGEGGGNFLMEGILSLKNVFAEKINSLWHEPYASFVAGLLYGYRGGLGDLQEDFNITGVSHIVAISGYNISVIAVVVTTVLTYFYIPRKKAFWIVVIGIVVFVLFAGAGASVVRAGIMGVLVLVSRQIGRVAKPLNMLLTAGVLLVLQNPLVLVWDAGFQLSFVATAGLIYLSPKLKEFFAVIPEFFGLRETVVSTISATIATLPLVLFYFGRISLVSIFVNVLILWVIPFIMLFGFLSVILALIFYPLAFILAGVTFAMLRYTVFVVEIFSKLPFASVNFDFPVYLVVIFYFLLVFGLRIFKLFKKI